MKPLPYHRLSGTKKNLVVDMNGYDIYACIFCGKEFKYIWNPGPIRVETKCRPTEAGRVLYEQEVEERKKRPLGWWTIIKHLHNSKCGKCGAYPRVVHNKHQVLFPFLKLQRQDDELLAYCPRGCKEE